MQVNTRKQGDIGVAAAALYYTAKGYSVSSPLSEAVRYDLLVDTGAEILRVQCKTSSHRPHGERYIVSLATIGVNTKTRTIKPLDRSEADVLFIWLSDGTTYEIPVSEVEGRRSLNMTFDRREQYAVSIEYEPLDDRESYQTTAQRGLYECVEEGCDNKTSRPGRKCRSCAHKGQSKVSWPSTKSELRDMVAENDNNKSKVAEILGCTETMVRKKLNDPKYV